MGRYALRMSDLYGSYAGTRAPARASTATIFGQTMFLVGIAITWLFGFALILGLSLGPVITYYVDTDADAVIQAAGGTAIITLGMGAYGLATSKDLAKWIRPLSFAMLGLLAIGLVLLLFGSGGSPLFSLAVLAISAAFLVVDFNYLRRHATEDDVVWLATGIFVSIVNIFLSLLNLFGGRN